MKVNEIFTSIEGEGIRAGSLCTFIRFSGCNLRCKWCDTAYAFDEGQEMSIDEIIDKIPEDVCNITLTGGEPLLQPELPKLIEKLILNNHEVNIETNGSISFSQLPRLFDKLMITADYKLPSSGMEDKMLKSELKNLHMDDVLKFVVGSKEDIERMEEAINIIKPRCHIFISPVFNSIKLTDIVDWMKASELAKVYDIRLQIQLHKVIWDPTTRGV